MRKHLCKSQMAVGPRSRQVSAQKDLFQQHTSKSYLELQQAAHYRRQVMNARHPPILIPTPIIPRPQLVPSTVKKKGPAVAPRRGAKKLRYVEALYAYTAQSDAEFDMAEGERFILKSKDTGDGWAEVEKGGESRSVPANYVQEI